MLLLGATLGLAGFVSAPAGAADDGAACLAVYLDVLDVAEADGEASNTIAWLAFDAGEIDGEALQAALTANSLVYTAIADAAEIVYLACLEDDAEDTTVPPADDPPADDPESETTTTAPDEETTTTTVLGSSELPRTGLGSTLPFGLAAIVLLGIGVALLGAARMRIEQS